MNFDEIEFNVKYLSLDDFPVWFYRFVKAFIEDTFYSKRTFYYKKRRFLKRR